MWRQAMTALSPERVLAMIAVIEAAKAFSAKYRIINCTEQQTLDGMIAALEKEQMK
jgi:hypothetical protein